VRSRAGFTLLEAMVATLIAGICLTAIFQLQHALVQGQQKQEAMLKKSALRRDALAIVRDINPDVTPDGDVDLPPDKSLHWSSRAVSEQKLSANFPSGDGRYYVTLYNVTVEVDGPDGMPLDSFEVERMGWTSQGQASVGLTGVAPAPAPTGG